MKKHKIKKRRIAKIRIKENQDVYDLTTEKNHNFFANKILVHNCVEIILRPNSFCNLTEVICRENDTKEILIEKVKKATILGCLQSTLTDFKFINYEFKKNCEEERLLGVSLTGTRDCKLLNTVNENSKNLLKELKEISIQIAKEWSENLLINMPAAVTCLKPSGCTSLETKIKTKNGIKSMKEIFDENEVDVFNETEQWFKPKQKIIVFDENNNEKQVTNLFINGMSEVYEIEDENGKIYKFTGDHKLKTINGWKRVDNLKENEEIITFS